MLAIQRKELGRDALVRQPYQELSNLLVFRLSVTQTTEKAFQTGLVPSHRTKMWGGTRQLCHPLYFSLCKHVQNALGLLQPFTTHLTF